MTHSVNIYVIIHIIFLIISIINLHDSKSLKNQYPKYSLILYGRSLELEYQWLNLLLFFQILDFIFFITYNNLLLFLSLNLVNIFFIVFYGFNIFKATIKIKKINNYISKKLNKKIQIHSLYLNNLYNLREGYIYWSENNIEVEDGKIISFIYDENNQLKIEESVMNFFDPNWKFKNFIEIGPSSLKNY